MNNFKIQPLPEIPESERTPLLDMIVLLYEQLSQYCRFNEEVIRQQANQLRAQGEQLQLQGEALLLQKEQIQCLKDEISILKGEKGRPKIKPSNLEKMSNNKKGKGGGKRAGSKKHKKKIKIHKEEIIKLEHVPKEWVFKGYKEYTVQDIEIKLNNKKYLLERWQMPNGKYVTGELPDGIKGHHFGVTLRVYIIKLYYEQRVTEPLILNNLLDLGVDISSGQINRILTEGHEVFHNEKDSILQSGLLVSKYINVDDTGARHKGKNGYCTHIGNKLFAWFSSTESKSRVNFLKLLQAGNTDYVIDDVALEYMQSRKLPKAQLEQIGFNIVLTDKDQWAEHLEKSGITSKRHKTIATEGALLGSIIAHGLSRELVIVSDDAGQFNVLGLLHSLCWVHAERTIHKIISFTDENKLAQKNVRSQIWEFYKELKEYQKNHTDDKKQILYKKFDEIFKQKTCFQTLNIALERLYRNKTELLLVLERPEIPLHNNLSENDIRDYVTKRKISATTRSDMGRKCRDTFLSLKKTCKKLGISFGEFLHDRLENKKQIQPLPQIIKLVAQSP